jgi:PAS domain S-box-containing protein
MMVSAGDKTLKASAWMVAVALILFVLAWVALAFTRTTGGIALLWPCNAVAVALAIRIKQLSPRRVIAIAILGMMAGNAAASASGPLVLILPFVAGLEVVLMTLGIRRLAIDARTLSGFGRLIAIAIPSAAVSAALSAGIVGMMNGVPMALVAYRWFASNLMGLVLLLPILLAVDRSDLRRLARPREALAAAAIALATAAIAVLVFYRAQQPLLFLLMPCMVFAAFRLRFVGAAIAIAVATAIGVVATTTGYGPIVAHFPVADRILYLQSFIVIAAIATIPVAIILTEMGGAFGRVREAQHELQLLTENANDMIVRLSLDGKRRYVSPASLRMLGYSPEEMLRRPEAIDVHPDDRAGIEAVRRSLLDGAVDPICTYRKRHLDGHYIWLEAAYRLITVDGRPTEFVTVVRDITSRRAAEQVASQALAEAEERERLLIMSEQLAKIGTWRLNRTDQTVFWSEEVYRIHGLPTSFVPTSATVIQAYHPDDRPLVEALFAKSIETGEPLRYEARLVRASGAIRWVAASGQAERSPNGDVVGLFGVFQDISEQVETLRDVIRAREEAEAALDAKAQFTATITHEIRTPLTSIIGTASLLRTSTDEAERRRHVDTLERSGHLLAAIVDDVLLFSKLTEGHGEPEAIEFDLRDIVNDVATVFSNDAAAKGLLIATSGAEESHWVIGDPARLARVLTNLVSNALKFTTQGGIAVTVRRPVEGDLWTFDVEDTGVGIRPDRVEAIFEPFVQADASTTRSHGGTGLGLSISRLLVESMGGEIGVEKGLYRGSCFRFTVPLPASSNELGASPIADRHGNGDRKRVLLAEDNDTNRYLISELVRKLGHEVIGVSDGAVALDMVRDAGNGGFDIVLMDVQMPVKDGMTASREIRALPHAKALPIFALTADTSTERRRAILYAGMNGLIAKPVDIEILRAAIEGGVPDERLAADGAVTPRSTAIDGERVTGFEATLGREARDLLLSLLIDDATAVPERIRAMVAAGRFDQAKLEAHGLRGAAASVGAYRLIEILMQVELAATDQDIGEALLSRLDIAAADVATCAGSMLDGSYGDRELSLSSSS